MMDDQEAKYPEHTKESNPQRAGCVKQGPSIAVDASVATEVYQHFCSKEGERRGLGQLHVVTVGKRPPATYNETIQRAYREANPKTSLNLHVGTITV